MGPGEKQRRQAHFWKKFLLLTRGRLDMVQALDVLVREEPNSGFQQCLRQLRAGVGNGHPLSEALDANPDEFSLGVRELVRRAELTGAWDEIIPLVADGLADGTLD